LRKRNFNFPLLFRLKEKAKKKIRKIFDAYQRQKKNEQKGGGRKFHFEEKIAICIRVSGYKVIVRFREYFGSKD
jgi:phosphomannomutase